MVSDDDWSSTVIRAAAPISAFALLADKSSQSALGHIGSLVATALRHLDRY